MLSNHLPYLLVDGLGCSLGVGFLEVVFIVVIVAEVGQLVTHAHIGNHAVGLLGDAFQVVHRSAADMAGEEFLGSSPSQRGTHLVEHLLAGGDLALLGQIPGSAQGTATRHDGHLDQRVGVLQQPADRGMSGLVEGDGAFLLGGHHLGLLLQSSDDAVHGG